MSAETSAGVFSGILICFFFSAHNLSWGRETALRLSRPSSARTKSAWVTA